MDFSLSLSSDWLNLINLPLMALTIRDVMPKWKNLWDSNLTSQDRTMLMRIVIFLALPVVVFIHELGHFTAAILLGVKVLGFHYGPVTGYVTINSYHQPPESLLWIAVAGSLAQIVLGFACLIAAFLIHRPAVIAFLVYLGLWAIGGTVIFYAALSLASLYGDWINIYTSPCHNLVFGIGIVHGALIALVVYCLTANAPRKWFATATMPGWNEREQELLKEAEINPSLENYIALASSSTEAGLYKEAEVWIKKAEAVAPDSPAISYARADLELACSRVDNALTIYDRLVKDERVTPAMRAQVYLQMGDIWLYRRDTGKSLGCFESATVLDPAQGDARLQKAMLKASTGSYEGLAEDLVQLKDPETQWIYRRNRDMASKEIQRLQTLITERK